jgi:hypothetical protein
VRAQEDETSDDVAARHFHRGVELFRAEDYAGALAEFEASFSAHPVPALRYNIGVCRYELGRIAEARTELGIYLFETDPTAVSPDRRLEVEEILADIDPRLALLHLRTDHPGAELSLDGAPAGVSPLPAPVPMLPGDHEVVVVVEGERVFEERFRTEAGERRVVVLSVRESVIETVEVPVVEVPVVEAPVVEAPVVEAPPPEEEGLSPVWFWAAAGATAGLAVAGTVTGILVEIGEDDFDDAVARCTSGCDPEACVDGEALGLDVLDLGTATTVLFAVAGAAAAAAIALALFTDFDGAAGSETPVVLGIGPSSDAAGRPGVGLGATFRF